MSQIAVSDAAAYAKMLVSGIATVNGADASSITDAIDVLAGASPAGSSFDLDATAEATYQAAKAAAQAAIDAAKASGS
jgi:hypothetical protein